MVSLVERLTIDRNENRIRYIEKISFADLPIYIIPRSWMKKIEVRIENAD